MELKTLNDFDKEYGFVSGNFGQLMKDFNLKDTEACETMHCIAHFTGDLRQEAIKWIKYLKNKDWVIAGEIPEIFKLKATEDTILGLNSIIYWIAHFFNIKDEELK